MPPAIFTAAKRNAILAFIRQHMVRTGRAPGYNAIGRAVGLTYAPTIARYVLDLIDAGELTRQPHKQGRSMIAVPGKPTPDEQRTAILTFVREYRTMPQKMPTYRAISQATGIRNLTAIADHVHALMTDGVIATPGERRHAGT